VTTQTNGKFDETHKKTDFDSPSDNIWIIHGRCYDVTDFVKHHPGGRETILLGKGRDCTALFESYHPFNRDKAAAVLEKYRIKEDDDDALLPPAEVVQSMIAYDFSEQDPFYDAMKERVAAVLLEHGIDPIEDRVATFQRWCYYLVMFAAAVICSVAHARVSAAKRDRERGTRLRFNPLI
jgi:hypothetical protein